MSETKEVVAATPKELMQRAQQEGSLKKFQSTDIATIFDQYKHQIAQALPKHLTADRMIQMAVTLISKNPKLKECSVGSLIGATMQASILGFRPVEALAYCYFVPYNNKKVDAQGKESWVKEVQFQIGYRGLMDLARRSGQIKSIHAFAVYQGDDFSYSLGINPDIKHVPNETEPKNPKNLTHVYAVSHYKDGGYNFVVLTKKEVEALRRRNAMQKEEAAGAWKTDYEAMAMAKAIKQLAKYLPLSDELQSMVQSDESIIDPKMFASDKSGDLVDIERPDYEDAIVDPDEEYKGLFEAADASAKKEKGK